MIRCPLCGLPESEHYYDRAAFGCRGFDGMEGHPYRPVGRKSNFFVNGLALAFYIGCTIVTGIFAYCMWSLL